MNLKSKILRNIFLPTGDVLFGQKMVQRLKYLEKAQYWNKQQIYYQQDLLLRRLIQTSFSQVPFYRKLAQQHGVSLDDIHSASDLAKLPVVSKQMLSQAYPAGVTRDTGQKTYEAKTSGSTGKNFVMLEDAETAGWYRASFMLALEWSGWQIGEPHLQTGMTLNRSADRRLKDKLLGCHYVSAYQLDDLHLDSILAAIDQKRLRYIWGYPGSIYYLARRANDMGWNQPMCAISTWGDSLYPAYRTVIEKAFKCQVFDTYGCAEGFQVAAQCEFGNYHLHALDVVVEYLDENHQPVPEGETGNLVITRLHPGPMPLIRYQVGDLGASGLSQTCPCGRGFPLMQSIQGRNADVVTTPSGNRLIVHFFTGILEHFKQIDSFQVEQVRTDRILLRIIPNSEMTQELIKTIIQTIQDKGAQELSVGVELVNSIPLSTAGKHKFVINSMDK